MQIAIPGAVSPASNFGNRTTASFQIDGFKYPQCNEIKTPRLPACSTTGKISLMAGS